MSDSMDPITPTETGSKKAAEFPVRTFIGVIMILLGVSLILQTTGIITDQAMKDAIGSGMVIAIGVALVIWRRRTWPWAAIIFLVGLTDLVENQQWAIFEEHTPWEYVWPVFLILIGVQVVLGRGRKTPEKAK